MVDDGSGGETHEVLRKWEGEGPPGLRKVLRNSEPVGPGGARNVGWRAAGGALIAFTDDDCEPDPSWVAEFVTAAESSPGAVLQGPTLPQPGQVHLISPFTRTLDVQELGPWFPACNMAYPRNLLEQVGGFDEAFTRGEDTDLAWRVRATGAEFEWVPGAEVKHAVLDLGPIGKVRLALAWEPAFPVFGRHPELRRELHLGLFWKPQHGLLLLAAFGALVSRRFPPALLLAIPYLRSVRARLAAESGHAYHAPWYVVHDGAEMLAAVRGSARSGTLVL